jgi:hypothetical protein
MPELYLLPIAINGNLRGPKYFACRATNFIGIVCKWAVMDYGFMPSGLLHAKDISAGDHASLIANADVFLFPLANLDQAVSNVTDIRTFFETFQVPTDWLTPSNTYRQLLRSLAGIFQFGQRYTGLSLQPLFGAGVTLDTRYRDLTAQQQGWFDATVTSFGYPSTIIRPNNTFRQMLKAAGDAWGAQPFYLGGVEF